MTELTDITEQYTEPIVYGVPLDNSNDENIPIESFTELNTNQNIHPHIQFINANGYIKKEENKLFFITPAQRPFHIKNITKVGKNPLRSSRFVLKITNSIFFKINENKNLDNESYISIVRFGKLKKNSCDTIAINIW